MSSLRTVIRHVKATSTKDSSRYLISLLVKSGVAPHREGITAISSSHVLLNVSSRAQGGAANKSVEMLLARTLSLPKSHVRLIKGLTSREKVAEVSMSMQQSPEETVEWLQETFTENVMSPKKEEMKDDG
jgi:uncharacterized protein YggU (UPF0235/DUF167 family)